MPEPTRFVRDRVTRLCYLLLAWFAYLQAAPGLVLPYLRNELHLTYSVGGLHVAAFAAGSLIAGVLGPRVERLLGRRTMLWSAAAVMGIGAIGLTAGGVVAVTVGSVLLLGLGGGTLLVTVQAVLADHHGELRTIAFTEANLAASAAYVVLIGVLSFTAAIGLGWRIALLASLLVPLLAWLANRRLPITAAPPVPDGSARLPGTFWIAAGMIICTTAIEWCVTGWGATFVGGAARLAPAAAVGLMGGYFGGVLVGRAVGSRLARRFEASRLLGLALALTAAGFLLLWPATTPGQAFAGLAVIGAGIGNLFPLGLSIAVALAPGRAGAASGRAVVASSIAVLLAPLTIGALADATSLSAAFLLVPVLLVLAAAGLALVQRGHRVAARV